MTKNALAKAGEAKEVYQVPALAPLLKDGKLTAQADTLASAFLEEVEGDRATVPSLPIIRIDHKVECFMINGEPQESIEGYPINFFQTRGYWSKSFRPGSTEPPECFSVDMVKPHPSVGEPCATLCATCKFSQFGTAQSGDADGQACRVTTYLCVLNPEFAGCPVGVVLCPPTSIRELIGSTRSPGYLSRAQQFERPNGQRAQFYEVVWSRFTLERAGDTHCVIIGEPLATPSDEEEIRAIARVRNSFRSEMDNLRGINAQKSIESAG